LRAGRDEIYIVRIEAVADPSPLKFDTPGRNDGDVEPEPDLEQLLQAISPLSEQELLDQVYRRLTLRLCGDCYRSWIENPTG